MLRVYKTLEKNQRFLSNVMRPQGQHDVLVKFNESWARKAESEYAEIAEWVAMMPGESVEVLH